MLYNFLGNLSTSDVKKKKKKRNKNPKDILYVVWGSTHTVFILWVLILRTTSFMWFSVFRRSVSSVQSPSHVRLFVTPWTAVHQASLSITKSCSLPKLMATHSSILAWKIPWKEKPGRLQSIGSQRVGHDWAKSGGRVWSAGCLGHNGLLSDPAAPSRPI